MTFDQAMLQIYERARDEVGYTPTRFLQMLHELGGLETARRLLPNMSDGFAKLWEKGRLDLTVEYVILQPQWRSLFTESELELARQRLLDCGLKF